MQLGSYQSKNFLWSLPFLTWQAFFYLVPFVLLVFLSFWTLKNFQIAPEWNLQNYKTIFSSSLYYLGYVRSFGIAAAVASIGLFLAYFYSYILVFKIPHKYRNVLLMITLTPLLTSFILRIYSWQIVFADKGLVNWLLLKLSIVAEPITFLFTWPVILVGLLSYLLPLPILILYNSMRNIDHSLIQAASGLGANEKNVILQIITPLARAGIATSWLVLFILSFADFIVPTILGGSSVYTFGLQIVDAIKVDNWPMAAALSMVMIATFSILAILILKIIQPTLKKR